MNREEVKDAEAALVVNQRLVTVGCIHHPQSGPLYVRNRCGMSWAVLSSRRRLSFRLGWPRVWYPALSRGPEKGTPRPKPGGELGPSRPCWGGSVRVQGLSVNRCSRRVVDGDFIGDNCCPYGVVPPAFSQVSTTLSAWVEFINEVRAKS